MRITRSRRLPARETDYRAQACLTEVGNTGAQTKGRGHPGRFSFLHYSKLISSQQLRGTSRTRIPHPLLHLLFQPSLPSLPVLLQGPLLPGACPLTAHQGQSPSAPGLLDHPGCHRGRLLSSQGGHSLSQPPRPAGH